MLLKLISMLFITLSLPAYSHELINIPQTLSLKETILLAIRENPNVQQAQLNHVLQKFALEVAHWEFQPHYQITGNVGVNQGRTAQLRNSQKSWGVQPGISWESPIGTQITFANVNSVSSNYNPLLSLQIVQPLMRGFGRPVVEATLYNAMDSERISRLNVENALRTTITDVITAYLTVMSAENIIKIDEEALQRSEESVAQTKLFIKAGRKAGVELVTVQADVANVRTTLENDRNSLEQARYALLAAIGINPNTQIKFTNIDVPALIRQYNIPTLVQTKQLTLQNDIQYQVDQITIAGALKRSVLLAEDAARWQLDLTGNAGVGGGGGGGQNAGFPSLINGANQTEGVQLNLTVPINDKAAKQAIMAAKIALKEAQMALTQEKWAKETAAINNWNTIYSTERAMHFAEDAAMLQQKTYKITFQKYSFGLIDSVELQSVEQQLIQRQQRLLDARIAYLKALVSLDQQVGQTLKTWDVQVRYS